MRRLRCVATWLCCAAIGVCCIAARPARADGFARLEEGGPLYLAARLTGLSAALKRLGIDQLPEVKKLRQQIGGIDPFDPAILGTSGLDVSAPIVAELATPLPGGKLGHTRVAATVRDPALLQTFLMALVASGQVPLTRVDAATPLGKLGVIASGAIDDVSFVVRLAPGALVWDGVARVGEGGRLPSAAEIARRFPLQPARPFRATRGARRLLGEGSSIAVYLDGRHAAALIAESADGAARLAARDIADAAKRARFLKRKRELAVRCNAAWAKAPSVFDDVALALVSDSRDLGLVLGWGTQAGPPLGGLKFTPVDDRGLDGAELGQRAAAVLTLYAANLKPFQALRRSGPFRSFDTLKQATDACSEPAAFHLVLRSWPLALGTLADSATKELNLPLLQSGGELRNLVLALRDAGGDSLRYAVNATFEPAARMLLQTVLNLAGDSEHATIGGHKATVYHVSLPLLENGQIVAALEGLAQSRIGFTVADSDDSLNWALRGLNAMPEAAPLPSPPSPSGVALPVARMALDLIQAAHIASRFNLDPQQQAAFDELARYKRLDAELTADGDLLKLTARAPLR